MDTWRVLLAGTAALSGLVAGFFAEKHVYRWLAGRVRNRGAGRAVLILVASILLIVMSTFVLIIAVPWLDEVAPVVTAVLLAVLLVAVLAVAMVFMPSTQPLSPLPAIRELKKAGAGRTQARLLGGGGAAVTFVVLLPAGFVLAISIAQP